jgi:general secretion pathway protein H
MRTGRSPGNGGFTLIELVVVLVFMGLAVSLTLPFLHRGVGALQSTASARRVVSFLNDARIRAVNSSAPVEVVYHFEERRFLQKPKKRIKKKLDYQLPRGVAVDRIEREGEVVEDGETAIVFYPLGDSSGGVLYLVGDQDRRFKITVGHLFSSPVLTREED